MARRIVAEFDAVTGPFLKKMDRIDRSITRFERGTLTGFNRVERGVNSLVASAGRLRTITGIFATGFGVDLGSRFLDQAKLIRNALREAGDDSEETFQRVFQSSVRALAGFRDTAAGVQRFQKALGDRQTINDSIRQLETLNKLLALSGKSQQERASTFIQFSQALQAGYLGGEELRAIRENAPIELTREIARVAGGTIQDLKELSQAGRLTTDVLVEALVNLESEADRRFGKIQVTIQDAAKVLSSGAIIAAEGFDKGLGISRAAVTGLTKLGEVLGTSGQAFETFGKAVQIAGAFLISSFAGRRISNVIGSIQDLSKARLQDVAAAEAQFARDARNLQLAQARLTSANATLASLTAQGAAEKRLAAAQASVTKAARSVTAAQSSVAASAAAATAAQNRLLLSSRALAGAASLVRGAWAFLGGWPGIILAAATAFVLFGNRAEATTDALERLRFNGADLQSATDNVTSAYEELTAAMRDAGDQADATALKLITASKKELEARKVLLESQKVEEQLVQGERVRLQRSLSAELDRLRQEREDALGVVGADPFERFRKGAPLTPSVITEEQRQQIDDINRLFDEQIRVVRRRLREIEAEITLAQQKIDETRKVLAESIPEVDVSQFVDDDELQEANRLLDSFVDSLRTSEEKQAATLDRMAAAREVLVKAYGEESDRVRELDAAMAQLREEMESAGRATGGLTDNLGALDVALRNVASIRLDLASQIAGVQAQIAGLNRGLSEGAVRAIPDARDAEKQILDAGGTWESAARAYEGVIADADALFKLEEQRDKRMSELFGGTSSSGGGGGGGRSALETRLEEARQIIESTMTDQERMARSIREAIALRDRLAQGTAAERALVEQLNESIARMKNEYEELQRVNDEFWDGLAQQVAGAIEDWKDFGSFVRSVLANLVRQFGPTFFQALFSGGNPIDAVRASIAHDGGRSGRTRTVPLAAFASAPRLHSGFMPDEYPAILQKGEAVIPKGMTQSLGGVTLVMNNDFRGADPSMKPYIDGRLRELRQEFEPRWVETARRMQQGRVKI